MKMNKTRLIFKQINSRSQDTMLRTADYPAGVRDILIENRNAFTIFMGEYPILANSNFRVSTENTNDILEMEEPIRFLGNNCFVLITYRILID